MSKVTDVIIRVELVHKGLSLVHAEVIIPLDKGPIHAGRLMDACQRSVAHCIDELQEQLDFS